MAVDVSSINKLDLGALVAGGLVFVLSLIPAWITSDIEGDMGALLSAGDLGGGTHAWYEINVLALLLLLLATVVVATKVFAPRALPPTLPVGTGVIAAGLAALGTAILVIRTLTTFESQSMGGVSYSVGPGWSGWLLMIAAVALTAFAVLGATGAGESLPWQQNARPTGTGTHGTTGTTTGGSHGTPGDTATPPAATNSPTGADPTAPPPAAPPAGQQPPAPGQQPPPGDEGTPRRPPL